MTTTAEPAQADFAPPVGPTTVGRWTMVWPVEDDTMTINELKAEALPELRQALVGQNVVMLDEPAWEIHDNVSWPHPDGSVDGLLLVAKAPAMRTSGQMPVPQ